MELVEPNEEADPDFLFQEGFDWLDEAAMGIREGAWTVYVTFREVRGDLELGSLNVSVKASFNHLTVNTVRVLKDKPTRQDVRDLCRMLEMERG